ncbi:hypothetical protein D3Z38_16505 [Clostridiales bacterium]|nr:hypothetical protein [Clostridiales bacterium]
MSEKNESGQWRQKKKYIRRENIELVKALQNKKLRTTQLREARKRLKAVQGCRKAYEGECTCVCSEPLKGRYGNNDVYYCKDWDEEIKTWVAQNERYNTKNIQHKVFMTKGGISVRSKSELFIADALELYHIPYKYDTVMALGERSVSPDFKILRPYDKKIILWEHYGLVNNESYLSDSERKRRTYKEHGFVPWDNLIETYDQKNGSIDIRTIDTLIQGFLLL